MTGHDRRAIAEHLELVHGAPGDSDTVPGWLFLGRGHEPERTDTGAVQYARWEEKAFRWPAQAAPALDYATDTDADVFHTPARSENPLRASARRRPNPVRWLWSDLDGMTDRARLKLAELVDRGAVTVDSGSGPDRVHVYLPLEEPVAPEVAEHLNRRLCAALDADPAVGGHGGYLRLAGTLNRKPAARGGAPVPVMLHPGTGGVFSAAELDEELPDAPPPPAGDHDVPDPEDIDLESLPGYLAAVVREPVVPGMDRSAAAYHLVNACHRAGLTVGQALEVASYHRPSVEKYGPRLPREVGRTWSKATADPGNAPATPATEPATDTGDEPATPAPRKRGPDSVATQLVRLAVDRYRFAQDDTGRAFAVPLDGPAIARPLDGGIGGLRDELAHRYFTEHGKAASKSALADATATLAGMAASSPTEPLALRSVVLDPHRVLVDLGRPDGQVVQVTPAGWELLDRSPVVFRRTELTGPMPNPARGADRLDALRRLVNVPDELVPLLLGWLVATFLTDAPRPILALFAEQGAGKTSAARALVGVVDPSPVPLRAAPSSLEAWIVAAAGSSVVAVDNVSRIEPWLSDALCRAATGEGLVRRKLYSDDALAVTTMRRSVVLTTIDAGALRGDLAERLLALELERIRPGARRTDAELAQALDHDRGAVLGVVLDTLAGVLAHRDDVPADLELPRMADFGRVLAALDRYAGTDALDAYRASLDRVAVDVVEGDPLAAALRSVALAGGFDGTATELLERIAAHRPERGYWPTTPRMLAGAVRRAAPTLRSVGVHIDARRTGGARRLTVAPMSDGRDHCDGGSYSDPQGKEGRGPAKPHESRGTGASQPSRPSLADYDLTDPDQQQRAVQELF